MRKWINPENVIVLAGAILAAILLLSRPFVGVADNGDFLRILNTVGLNYYDPFESYEERFFAYSHSRFAYDTPFSGFYPSSQIIFLLLLRLISQIVHPGFFDIRLLGVFYALLLLTALWLLVRHNGRGSLVVGLLLGVAVLFVFFDIGYLAYFNSLFGEPVSMISMLLVFALGLTLLNQDHPTRRVLVLLFVAIFFLVNAKVQNAPIGVLFSLIFLRFAFIRHDKRWKWLAFGLSAALLLNSVVLYVTAPKELKHINLYQTFFFGVLYNSPDVKSDLEELGLPQRLEVLAGTNYFESGTAIPQTDPSLGPDFYDRVSHMDVLLFYLRHPDRLIKNMEYAAENSFSIRPYYLGNYEKSEGKPPNALSFTYSGWSEFKNNHLPHTIGFLAFFYLVYYGGAVYEWLRSKDRRSKVQVEWLMLQGLIGIFAFMVPIVGDGRADIGKHLFLFNVSFDMMVIAMFVWIAHKSVWLVARKQSS